MTCMLDALKCMGLMVRFWEEFYHLVCAIWYFRMFVVRKVLCMQFGTLTWIIDVFAVISECHFNMVAASHCSCCSQCVGRGQGSAAGAAEDHMTCMLDALKCGAIHMMAATSTTWSYLKRAWDNDLKFERASRSLAKTGFRDPGMWSKCTK